MSNRPPAIDAHVHIQPWETMKPQALETIRRGRRDHALIEECMRSPAALVELLDAQGLERVALINYVAPDIMGFGIDVNEWVAQYRDQAPDRLIAFGGYHPGTVPDVRDEVVRIFDDLGVDALKIHPPH